MKVLVVDDEIKLSELLAEVLEKKQMDVMQANSYAEALTKFDDSVELVILDIMLGDETGFPLLEKIKKDSPDTLVYMFTAHDVEDLIIKAKKLGADGFIPKPFNIKYIFDFLIPKIEEVQRKKLMSQRQEK